MSHSGRAAGTIWGERAMTDEAALWRAVEAVPGDRMPKLALADYLEERGDADAAHALRWMAANRVMPVRARRRWHWTWEEPCGLPPFLFDEVADRSFVSLRGAVGELGGAIARVRAALAADV